jgi:THAP domain
MEPCNQCCLCSNKCEKGSNRSFFLVPKEPERRQKWIDFIRRIRKNNSWEPGKYSRICSDHFTRSDFERKSLQDIQNLNIRNFLTRAAVPTVVLPALLAQADSSVRSKGKDLMVILTECETPNRFSFS